MTDLKSKNIIVTGASGGIGNSIIEKLDQAEANILASGTREEKLEELKGRYGKIKTLKFDISQSDKIEEFIENATKELGGSLDCIVNNAGITQDNLAIRMSLDEWKKVIDINLNGSFICAKIAFKIMKDQNPQGGRIINNGSVSAHVPRPGSSPYTSSKHAITGLTKSISLDGRPFNIACSQIDIGNALTEMVKKMKSGINQADGSVKSEATMDPIHIANNVYNIAELPLDALYWQRII